MKKIELLGLDQNICYEELKNGLKVVLIPFKNKKNYYVNYFTKYGSVNLDFIPDDSGKVYNSPKGIAHFLEHKMFETESGEDPFAFFGKSGTDCNACTGYTSTCYYISGINNLEDNLNYLINYVNEPYFTDQNVEKEKGIIIEEIKMYDDDPDWILEEEIHKAVFYNHPIRYDIAGYADTVSSITKEDLYKCYEMFYQPSNMMIVISGNFDIDKIMDVINNNKKLNDREDKYEIKQVKQEEKDNVNEKYKEISCSKIVVPKIGIDFKISLKDIEDVYNYNIYVSSIIDLVFGSSSTFKEEIYKKGYASYIATNKLLMDEYLLVEFYIEGNNPKEILNEILDRFKNYTISEEELTRYKKVLIASFVMNSDNVQGLADSIVGDYVNFGRIIDNKVDIVRNMNYKEFNKIRDELNIDNYSTIVLKNNIK